MLRHWRSCVLVAVSCSRLMAQPKPGDIFREYAYTSDMIVEFYASDKQKDPKAMQRKAVSHRERNLDIWDLEDAERAEIALEFWGGHPGTAGQAVRVNAGGFTEIPQIEGTPTDPHCYHRMLPGTAVVPIPVSSLRQGRNVFEFRAGPQVCHSIDWAIYKVYSFTVRIYYNSSKAHPTGRIVSPGPGSAIGDMPVIEAETQGSPAAPGKAEFTPGPVRKVEFVGLYEDFNWEGDGVFKRWHYQTDQGVMRHHLGTAMDKPYRVTWDNRWTPDQDEPVKIAARITNVHGITYMTPAAEFRLTRPRRSVKMYKASQIPEAFGVRVGRTMNCKMTIADDPRRATGARLAISTWAGNHGDGLGFNGTKICDRVGKDDYFSYDMVQFDPKVLHAGDNDFFIFSKTVDHQFEVNWPGPAVLLEFEKKP